MNLLIFTAIVVLALIISLFTIALKVKLVFNSNMPYANLTLAWLEPFIKVLVFMENSVPIIKVHFFNKLLLQWAFKQKNKKRGNVDIVKLVNPMDINVNLNYGFKDPFATGITCGAVNAASSLIDIDSFTHIPDFISENDYIYLDASAKVNIGQALVKLFMFKNSPK